VYLVGGGDYGFNLSHRLDSHVYVIKARDELVMIDAGFDGPEDILQNMKDDGLNPANVSRIFITHYHADHTGALARMKRLTGAQVLAGAEAAPTIRVADAEQIGLKWAQTFNFYPPEFVWEACEVAQEFTDGDTFKIGDFEMEAIYTPGHCYGHYCLLLRGQDRCYLFSSDHIFVGGFIILQNVRDSSVQEYAASMNKVLDYDFDALLPGHASISLRNGKRHQPARPDWRAH
jgi:glyoxylase-like metal-dependent hydrolase (beta-lactamase superfamily II)